MHIRTRRSALKHRKRAGFRKKMKTKAGRKIVNRQRSRSSGKGKRKQGKLGLGKKLDARGKRQ
jgi:ribosomal protein L34